MGVVFVLMHEMMLSDMILQVFYGGSSVLILPLKLLTEKSKIFILLGSIRDPLYFFFFKGIIPKFSKAVLGAESLEIPWVVAGRGVGRVSKKPQLVPLRGYGWKVLVAHFLLLVQKEHPQEWPAAFRP